MSYNLHSMNKTLSGQLLTGGNGRMDKEITSLWQIEQWQPYVNITVSIQASGWIEKSVTNTLCMSPKEIF